MYQALCKSCKLDMALCLLPDVAGSRREESESEGWGRSAHEVKAISLLSRRVELTGLQPRRGVIW